MEMDDATDIRWSDDDADDDASGDNLFSTKARTGPMDDHLYIFITSPHAAATHSGCVVAHHQSLRLRDRKRIPESLAWVVHDLP